MAKVKVRCLLCGWEGRRVKAKEYIPCSKCGGIVTDEFLVAVNDEASREASREASHIVDENIKDAEKTRKKQGPCIFCGETERLIPATGKCFSCLTCGYQSWKTYRIKGRKPVKREGAKVGRNELCPCGSGKKYKKCCKK